MLAAKLAGDQPSLASTISRAAGAASRTAAIRSGSPSAPSLILRSGRSCAALRRLGHRFRRSEAQREGGFDRRGAARRPAIVAAGRPGELGLEIPKRAVDRVSRRARRHRGCSACAVETGRDGAGHRSDCRRDALDGFAVARIGNRFAAADGVAVAEWWRRRRRPRSWRRGKWRSGRRSASVPRQPQGIVCICRRSSACRALPSQAHSARGQ